MALNFHLLIWRQNITVSNIIPPTWGENFIVSNIYSYPGVRILYHKISTPSLGWEYYIIKHSLLYMGWQYYSIKYSPFLPDDEKVLNVHLLASHWVAQENIPFVVLQDREKGLPFSTNFEETISSFSFAINSNSNHNLMGENKSHNS